MTKRLIPIPSSEKNAGQSRRPLHRLTAPTQLARHLLHAPAPLILNLAALDLACRLYMLSKTYSTSQASSQTWIPTAWGLFLTTIRTLTSLLRPLRQRHRPAEEAQDAARFDAYFRPYLVLNTISMFLPAVTLASLLRETWLRRAAGDTNEYRPGAYPTDFIPALYWDGLGEAGHARILFACGLAGACCLLGILVGMGVSGRYSGGVQKVGMGLYFGYLGVVLLVAAGMMDCFAVMVIDGLVHELTGKWGDGMMRAGDRAVEWIACSA